MNQKSIFFNNDTVSYKMYGAGKTVVLVHGFGEDSSIWDAQVEFLQKDFRLIVPDLPGTGRSSFIQKENISVADYAESVKAILDEEEILSCVLIGHSMGGYISLAFAGRYPEMLSGLGLVHSGAYADDEEKIATRNKGINFIKENGVEAFLKTSVTGLFFDVEKSRGDIATLLEKGKKISADAVIQYSEAMIARRDTTDVLKSATFPVLFIIGEHDKAIPFKHSLEQSHLPALSHVHILRHSAHMGMSEQTDKVDKFLGEFLRLS